VGRLFWIFGIWVGRKNVKNCIWVGRIFANLVFGWVAFSQIWYLGGSQKRQQIVFGWVAFSQIWYLGGWNFRKFDICVGRFFTNLQFSVKGSNMLSETCVNNVSKYIGGWCCLHIFNTGCFFTINLN
jgi:hypothetical protein